MAKDTENRREVVEEVRQATSLEGNLGNLANALGGGTMPEAASSNSGNKMENGVVKPEDHHINVASLGGIPSGNVGEGHKIGKGSGWGPSLLVNSGTKTASTDPAPASNIQDADLGDLTPLIADILSFNFSDNRQQEITALHSAVKSQLTKLSAKRVVANTQAKVKNAKQFYITESGSLRTEFSILGQKYSMLVKGAFTGNEILYPTVDGDIVVGVIMREGPNGLENATHDFEITINKGWKE